MNKALLFLVFFLFALSVKAEFEKGLIFQPTSKLPSNHASTLIALPDGDLLCVWYAGKREGAPDVALYLSRYEKEKGSWSQPRLLIDTPNKPEGNPVLFYAPDGKVWLFFVTIEGLNWTMAAIKYTVSEDGGKTFGEVKYFRKKWGWMPRNHILVLSSGEWLFPLYDEVFCNAVFMISKDGGASWEKAGRIKSIPGNEQPAVVELDDGTLLALMRTCGRGSYIWRAYSKDKGFTWTKAEQIELPNPNAGIDLLKLRTGELVVAYNDSQRKRTPLSLAISTDNGKTWKKVYDIETEKGEFSYPSLAQAPDGKIWMTYTWKRKSIGWIKFDRKWLLDKLNSPNR